MATPDASQPTAVERILANPGGRRIVDSLAFAVRSERNAEVARRDALAFNSGNPLEIDRLAKAHGLQSKLDRWQSRGRYFADAGLTPSRATRNELALLYMKAFDPMAISAMAYGIGIGATAIPGGQFVGDALKAFGTVAGGVSGLFLTAGLLIAVPDSVYKKLRHPIRALQRRSAERTLVRELGRAVSRDLRQPTENARSRIAEAGRGILAAFPQGTSGESLLKVQAQERQSLLDNALAEIRATADALEGDWDAADLVGRVAPRTESGPRPTGEIGRDDTRGFTRDA